MDIALMEHFRVLAEVRHFGHAAERLGIGQPVLSRSIQRLEAEIGGRLFDRGRTGARLTPLGETLRPHAERLLADWRRTQRAVAAERAGANAPLAIGATMAGIETVVIPALSRLSRSDGPTIRVRIDMSDRLIEALVNGEFDFIVAPLPARLPPDVDHVVLRTEPVHIVARSGHPLARGPLGAADLAGSVWALPGPSVWLRGAITGFLARYSLPPPTVRVQVDQIGARMLELVATSDLIAPYVGPVPADSGVAPLQIRGLSLQRRLQLAWRSSEPLPAHSRALLAALRGRLGRVETP